MYCGVCKCLVDAFNTSDGSAQHACTNDHFVCNKCAQTTNTCNCTAKIKIIDTFLDSATSTSRYFCRRLIHTCPNTPCTFISMSSAHVAIHAAFSCPNAHTKHVYTPLKTCNPVYTTTLNTVTISTPSLIRACTAVFSYSTPSYEPCITPDSAYGSPTPDGAPCPDVAIYLDFTAHTVTVLHTRVPIYIIIHTPRTMFFTTASPATLPYTEQCMFLRCPINDPMSIVVYPVFKPYPADPTTWHLLNPYRACANTVAHWQHTFKAELAHLADTLLSSSAASTMCVTPLSFQPTQPTGSGMAPSCIAAFATIATTLYHTPSPIVFYVPATPRSDAFFVCSIDDASGTSAHIMCPGCHNLFSLSGSLETSFCKHVNISEPHLRSEARRFDTHAHHPLATDKMTPCARRIWVSDIGHQSIPAARRMYMNMYPMQDTINTLISLDREPLVYYGALLTIANTTSLVGVSIASNRVDIVLDDIHTPVYEHTTTCIICGETDPNPTIHSIAAHFAISVDIVANFCNLKFNTSHTQYTFTTTDILTNQIPR